MARQPRPTVAPSATHRRDHARMMQPHEVATWNAAHPVGTLVEVRQAVGVATHRARTASPLRLWGSYGLLELDGGGSVTLDRVRVVGSELSDGSDRQPPIP